MYHVLAIAFIASLPLLFLAYVNNFGGETKWHKVYRCCSCNKVVNPRIRYKVCPYCGSSGVFEFTYQTVARWVPTGLLKGKYEFKE